MAVTLVAVALAAPGAQRPHAQPAARPFQLRYVLQPDCFRPSLAAPCDRRKTENRLDLGPQIAVWLESAGGAFVDTLMVTSGVATRGLGNRPGHFSLPSSPKFPYGKRLMALPVWAHARGKLYDVVVMQDGGPEREYWLGFHEAVSSPDPYYCRPMALSEIDVDAITCPTAVFNSVKGKLAPTLPRVPYPPRNDLRMFTDRDCDERPGPSCPMSARGFADINDLDAVATATPPYGQPFVGSWTVPAAVPDGDYLLAVEVSKEFDTNAAHHYPAFTDPALRESGLKNNFGQPSVVYRVPFRLSRAAGTQAAASEIAGYGDWNGASGRLHPSDGSISDTPGSGAGRLLVISRPSIVPGGAPFLGRVHVYAEPAPEVPPPPDGGEPVPPADASGATEGAGPSLDGGPPGGAPDGGAERDAPVGSPPPCPEPAAAVAGLVVPAATLRAESARAHFVEPPDPVFSRIDSYEARVWQGGETTPAAFLAGVPIQSARPAAPGGQVTVELTDLKGQQTYTVGVRASGGCLESELAYATFTTPTRKFTQLSGCFIATAAYGSPQAAHVQALRRVRDRARATSALAAAGAAIYERASPPLAALLRGSQPARALVRAALAPVVGVVEVVVGRTE